MKAHGLRNCLTGLMLVAVLLGGFTMALSVVGYAAETKSTPVNLINLHAHSGQLSNKECLACHSKITTSVTLDRKIKTFHRLHLESKLPTPKNCADCHQAVDLRNGSAAALRKQVNPQICAGCHTGAMTGAKVLFAH
jgi:predicted CXXCH cytochrome family protein